MEKLYDQALVEAYLKQTGYEAVMGDFRKNLWVARYGKGEFVTSPLQPEPLFQIVVQGSLNIYCIRDDGSVHALSHGHETYLLGEMELFSQQTNNVYAEANEELVCLALSIGEHKEELLRNPLFLRQLCKSLTEKIQSLTAMDAAPASLRERVLTYMKYRCSRNELKGLQQAAFHLNCSARQLQRILGQYEAEGIVTKIGKGSYRLTGGPGGFKRP